jgi:hypothetical protein
MEKSEHCRRLLASLSDYVDEVLEEELCSELEHHLSGCEDCQVVVDTLRKTISLYHSTATPPPVPTEVRERLYKRLNLEDFLSSSEKAGNYNDQG